MKKKGKTKAMETDEDQVYAAAPRKKGKRKATSDDDKDIQMVEQPKKQKTGRAGSEMKETGTTARTRTKSSNRAASTAIAKANEEKDDTGGVDVAQKNAKKRKINIFPTGNDAIQFSFGTMSNVCFSRFSYRVFFSFAEGYVDIAQ